MKPRGIVLRGLARREEALASLQERLKAEPKCAWAHAVLGEVFRELGSRVRGYAEIQKAIQLDPDCSFAEEFLEGGETRDSAWVFALRGGCDRTKERFDSAEADFLKAVDLDPGCGWAWGWLGELYLRTGRLPQAVSALNRAVALFAEWSEAFAWRGEVRRLLGDNKGALEDLDHSVALGHRDYGVHISRGAARLALGDAEGQLKDLTEAVRLAPAVFKGKAAELKDKSSAKLITGILNRIQDSESLFQKAKQASGLGRAALLDRCLDIDPANVNAILARAEANEGLGRYDQALKDADSAVKLNPSSETYARRANVAQKLGYMEAALRDTSLAVSISPSAPLYQWRSQTFLGMRHYDLAIKDISAALELDCDNAELYNLRAHVNLLLGRLSSAGEDVDRALTIAPDHVNLHLRRGQLLALQGRFDEARKSLAYLRRTAPAWAHFIDGYVLCVEKRYADAGRAFSKAGALAGDAEPQLRTQAEIYGTVSKAMGARTSQTAKGGGSPKQKGKVYLCGLGVYPPQTATVEVLRGISECDVIFNNLPGIGMSEFLGLFCANRRPVAFRYEQDAKLCADLVLSEIRPGRTVGFVTFGHPLLFGPLSHEIIKRCRAEGVPCKAFGAVSSMDAVLAASGQVLGYSYGGYQLFETTGTRILEDIADASAKLPLVVYFADGMGEQWFAKFVRILKKNYPRGHVCLLYGPRHELWETGQDRIPLDELGKLSHHKLAQGILFVPPR